MQNPPAKGICFTKPCNDKFPCFTANKVAYSMFTWQEKKDSSEIQPAVQEWVHKISIY